MHKAKNTAIAARLLRKTSNRVTIPSTNKVRTNRGNVAQARTLRVKVQVPVKLSVMLLHRTDDTKEDVTANPSPHSPAQPHIVPRYGCAEYVGVVGAGCADGVDVDDVVAL